MASRNKTLAIRVPVETILRVRQPGRGDRERIIYQNDTASVLDQNGKASQQFKVKNVVTSTMSLDKITKEYLGQHAQSVVNGYNLLVMSVGTSNSGKEGLFEGTKRQGLISLLMQQVCIECQSSLHANYQNLDFFFQVRAIEIVEQRVIDLFNQSLPTTYSLVDNVWEGVVLEGCSVLKAQNYTDLTEKINQISRTRVNFLNLISGATSKTSSFITISLIQEYKLDNRRATMCSKIMFAQLPGLEVLKDNQIDLRIREQNRSIRGIVAFSSLIKELSDQDAEGSPLYEVSNVTFAMKQFLGTNAYCVAIMSVANEDPEGSLKTLTCLKSLSKVSQYPIVNQGQTLGLMYRLRSDLASLKVPEVREKLSEKAIASERIMNADSNNSKLRAEDDYKRILTKYKQAKGKLEQNLRKKGDLQLLLIRSEQEKLQLTRALVQLQIENTKLMEQKQLKEYSMGKRNNKLEDALMKRESEKSLGMQNMSDLNERYQQLNQDYRDLEIEFMALKKNYLVCQKQLEESRKQTQRIQLDYINLTNQNKYLQGQLFNSSKEDREKYQLEQLNKYHQDRNQWMQKESNYKKEVEGLRKQLLKTGSNFPSQLQASSASSESANPSLQNQKIQMKNRQRLVERRAAQLEQHIRILNQDIEDYKAQNETLTQSLETTSSFYRNKLDQLIKSGDRNAASKALNDHMSREKDSSFNRIVQLNQNIQKLKSSNRGLRIYALQLRTLLSQYLPRGLDLPQYLAQGPASEDDIRELENREILRLNQKIQHLESQIRNQSPSHTSQRPVTNQRLQQQIAFLKQSRVGTPSDNQQSLRRQRNQLREENAKLTSMLKDNKRLDLAVVTKENDQLKYELEKYKGKDSVSPVSNDQKIIYYEKHIKKLERQRSQLLVRATMAEEQLKTYQNHFEKKR